YYPHRASGAIISSLFDASLAHHQLCHQPVIFMKKADRVKSRREPGNINPLFVNAGGDVFLVDDPSKSISQGEPAAAIEISKGDDYLIFCRIRSKGKRIDQRSRNTRSDPAQIAGLIKSLHINIEVSGGSGIALIQPNGDEFI